jgi:hypothetical protein
MIFAFTAKKKESFCAVITVQGLTIIAANASIPATLKWWTSRIGYARVAD